MPTETPAPPAEPVKRQSFFGSFIQTYSSFLSSFVIGAAGLIATTQYQWNQAKIAAKQAEAQIRITETQADNNWKIERAKILSQNLQVLSQQGSGNVEQRYGVLLSLSRGNILDPELAVSYALELGKENPEYMRSVLANTQEKDYRRLAGAFVVTCEQRYGLARAVDTCKNDKQGERSAAVADVISEELETALGQHKAGPLALLKEDREVLANLTRTVWLFAPFLDDQYERRSWDVLERVAGTSASARLVVALALLSVNNGVFVTSAESSQLERFHTDQRRWLASFLLGPGCDTECRGKVASMMLSAYRRAGSDFDAALQAVLSRPRPESAPVLNRLNQRLLLCQVTEGDAVALRDQTLVPMVVGLLAQDKPDTARMDDLLGLLALLPPLVAPLPPAPVAGTAPAPVVAPTLATARDPVSRWRLLQDLLQRIEGGRFLKVLAERRTQRQRAQRMLTPSLRKANFCNVSVGASEEDADEG